MLLILSWFGRHFYNEINGKEKRHHPFRFRSKKRKKSYAKKTKLRHEVISFCTALVMMVLVAMMVVMIVVVMTVAIMI